MPMQKELYPTDWANIALRVKSKAAWTCQGCGRPCRRPGEQPSIFLARVRNSKSENRFDFFRKDSKTFASGRFVLTVAHLDHDPWNPSARLKALCAPCHCRYDRTPVEIERKRFAKREYFGQGTLGLS